MQEYVDDSIGEMAGHLKMELLSLRENLRVGAITQQQAANRLATLRRRRQAALDEVNPQPALFRRRGGPSTLQRSLAANGTANYRDAAGGGVTTARQRPVSKYDWP